MLYNSVHNMQLTPVKGDMVEKVLRDKEGRLVRATFYIYESGDRLKARLVDLVYISEKVIKSAALFLSGFSKKNTQGYPVYDCKSIVSPFFNKEILYFSGSKPRAPTF